MLFYRCALLALGFLLFQCALSGHMVHYEKRDLQQCVVGAHTFVVQRDLIDGQLAEQFKVDGIIVTEVAYDKAMSDAEQTERVALREHERALLVETADEIDRVQRAAAVKLVALRLDSLCQELKRIQEYELEPHLMWAEDTIASRNDYDELVQIKVVEAEKTRAHNDKNTGELRDLAEHLEDYAKRVHKLFLASVDHVIAHTNDTKLLKRLMDLV